MLMIKYRNDELSVVIPENILRKIYKICSGSNKFETGGIIYGRYTENLDSALILKITSPPIDSKRTKTSFKRGVAGIKQEIKRLWKKDIYYLGEWHYHPNFSSEPSNQDIKQMIKISKNKNFNCPEPILIIVGENQNNFCITVQIFIKNEKITLFQEN